MVAVIPKVESEGAARAFIYHQGTFLTCGHAEVTTKSAIARRDDLMALKPIVVVVHKFDFEVNLSYCATSR